MSLTIDVRVESNDSGVIDEFLKVSNLPSMIRAASTKSIDLSLKVIDSLSAASDHVSLHFCEVSVHCCSVFGYEISKSLKFSGLFGSELVSVV